MTNFNPDYDDSLLDELGEYGQSLYKALQTVERENRKPVMIKMSEAMRGKIFGPPLQDRPSVKARNDFAAFCGYPVTITELPVSVLAEVFTNNPTFQVQVRDPHAPTE